MHLTRTSVAVTLAALTLLAVYVAVWVRFPGSELSRRADYVAFYAAGRLPPGELYDAGAQASVEAQVYGAPFPVAGGLLPFNHPPVLVPVLRLLTTEDYAASYLRWTALLWLISAACALAVYRLRKDLALALAALSFYPLFGANLKGQETAFVLLGLLLFALLLKGGRDFWAGCALALTCLKPHFAVFLAPPLLTRPKAFAGFAGAGLTLALYSLLLVGPQGFKGLLALTRLSAAGEGYGMNERDMVNLLGLLVRAGVPGAGAIAWAAFALASVAALWLWRRTPGPPPLAATVALMVFTSPHLHAHDLSLAVAAYAAAGGAPVLLAASLLFGAAQTVAPGCVYAAGYAAVAAPLIPFRKRPA